jgi:hypothetical protein
MLRGNGLLTPLQRAFLVAFASVPDARHFWLAGGTALAEFYLGHRLSFDLDFFTPEADLILPVSRQIEALGSERGFEIAMVRRFSTFVEFLVSRGTDQLKVDLALDTPVQFDPPVVSEYGALVSSFADLKIDKLLAYFGRAEPRDAVDLFFILQGQAADELLTLATQKDAGFDLYWFAAALNRADEFPDELSRWPVHMLRPFDPVELKRQFRSLALELMARLTAPRP